MANLDYFCERMRYWCDEGNLGYDQIQRWTIWYGGECDCSSLVIHALQEAGFDTGSASYTGDLSWNLTQHGWDRLDPNLHTARPGDILLNDSQHVAAVVGGWGWYSTIAEAWLDENGGIYYGQAGDQTGWETHTRGIYDYPWNCILRFAGESEDDMRAADVWEYNYKNSAPGGNMYNCATNTNANVAALVNDVLRKDMSDVAKNTGINVNSGAGMHERLAYCEAYIRQIMAKIDKIQPNNTAATVNIDYDKLANKVADVIYNRMKA